MAQTQPVNETPTTTTRTAPPPRRRRGGIVTFLVALIVIVIAVIVLVVVNGGTNVSYHASITGVQPLSPTQVSVTVQVTNSGSSSGTPACTINVKSPNGAYTGEGVVTASQALPKGAQTTLHETVTVTHGGAHFVTAAASSLSCV